MGDDLEIEVSDVPAGIARAAVVRLQLALAVSEGGDSVFQHVEQGRGRPQHPVCGEREDRIALHLLDLQRRGDLPHDLPEQLRDDRRAVLELGRGDELCEARDVRQGPGRRARPQ